jgi:hypothetical protein
MSQLNILEAAKTIRQFLPTLLGSEASEVDQQLADLIIRCQAGETLENQITSLLASHNDTKRWMLEHKEVFSTNATRGLGGEQNHQLPGVAFVSAPRYVCPEGDYIWHHIDSSDPIPICPTHNCPLRRDES